MASIKMIDTPKFYTKEDLDAMNYFSGTGFYKQYQDPSVRPNIFDSRQISMPVENYKPSVSSIF